MPCCAAINCSNRIEKGWKLYRFPQGTRRAQWVQNLQRGNNWTPTQCSYLCEKHFEGSQFENHRNDGWKKLKPNATPTLFDVQNPPSMIDPPLRKSLYKKLNKNVLPDNLPTPAKIAKPAISEQKDLFDAGNVIQEHKPSPVPVQVCPVQEIPESEVDELIRLRHENQELRMELEAERAKSDEPMIIYIYR